VIWSAYFWLAKFFFTPNAVNFWSVLVFWTLGIIPLGILAMVGKPASTLALTGERHRLGRIVHRTVGHFFEI
jgi:hypothetical protein